MADGSVIIDTKLDQSGLKEGLADVGVSLSKGITKAVAAAGSALAGLGGYAVKVGSDFEYAISGVAATMGTTVDSIDAIKNKALELGASTKFTATEAADGFNILAMAGLSADEQLQAIGATLNLAAAGEMSMDDAAGYLTTTVKAWMTVHTSRICTRKVLRLQIRPPLSLAMQFLPLHLLAVRITSPCPRLRLRYLRWPKKAIRGLPPATTLQGQCPICMRRRNMRRRRLMRSAFPSMTVLEDREISLILSTI